MLPGLHGHVCSYLTLTIICKRLIKIRFTDKSYRDKTCQVKSINQNILGHYLLETKHIGSTTHQYNKPFSYETYQDIYWLDKTYRLTKPIGRTKPIHRQNLRFSWSMVSGRQWIWTLRRSSHSQEEKGVSLVVIM